MANQNDSDICEYLVALPNELILSGLFAKAEQFQDDACYWQVLAACWIKAGEHANRDVWCHLFASPRRGRWKMMKPPDRRRFNRLPKTVKAFRAYSDGEDLGLALSWSLDRAVCSRIWPERQVAERTFAVGQIEALFHRRSEAEILVRPRDGWKRLPTA